MYLIKCKLGTTQYNINEDAKAVKSKTTKQQNKDLDKSVRYSFSVMYC